MSRFRGLLSVAVVAAIPILATACFGGSSPSSEKKQKARQGKSSGSPEFLPPGGMRKVIREGGATLKFVVYGGSGEINDEGLSVHPRPGNHFTGVKVGIRNVGSTAYRRNLLVASRITNDEGDIFRALSLGTNRGLDKILLKKDQTAYGRIFFEIRDETRLQTFRFRPSPTAEPSVFVIRGAGKEGSTKLLKKGGTAKIFKRGKTQRIKAVVYGGSGEIKPTAIGLTPKAGNHFTSVKVGIKNLGSKTYAANLLGATRITNNEDKVFWPVDVEGSGLDKVLLARGETAFGRIFFQIADGTKLRSVRFRPFGPKSKFAVFTISHGA